MLRRFGPFLVLLLTWIGCSSVTMAWNHLNDNSLTAEAITQRLQSAAKVEVDLTGSDPAVFAKSNQDMPVIPGAALYKKYCQVCHATGIAGAPKFKHSEDWVPRLAEGKDIVLKKAMGGFKSMPAKGNCSQCSADQIWEAIEYMSGPTP